MQITFTGNPQKDAALLQKTEELHILTPATQDAEIAARIRNANLNFAELRGRAGGLADDGGRLTVGDIKGDEQQ